MKETRFRDGPVSLFALHPSASLWQKSCLIRIVGVDGELRDQAMRLIVEHFLGLQKLDWSPGSVSLLVGPNGAGKTTVLDALDFLANTYRIGVSNAVRRIGTAAFKHLAADLDAAVVFELHDADCRYRFECIAKSGGVDAYPAERGWCGERLDIVRMAGSATWTFQDAPQETSELAPDRSALRSNFEERLLTSPWKQFASFIHSIRIYDAWWLNALRHPSSAHAEDPDAYLHRTGRNLLGVLNRWKNGERSLQRQYEWIIKTAKDAFFDIFDDLRIESEGNDHRGYFYPPGLETEVGLPLRRAPDGLLVGLLHLTAIAGAREGSIVGLDEMENQLHPHAIRVLIKAMRERAEEKRLTILLTTHSPVLMNEFRGDRMDDFYLIEQGAKVMPQRLSEAYRPEWLAQFLPGDLYENLKVAKPKRPA
jgi:predicted ATPase